MTQRARIHDDDIDRPRPDDDLEIGYARDVVNRMIGTGHHAKPRQIGWIEIRREVHAANESGVIDTQRICGTSRPVEMIGRFFGAVCSSCGNVAPPTLKCHRARQAQNDPPAITPFRGLLTAASPPGSHRTQIHPRRNGCHARRTGRSMLIADEPNHERDASTLHNTNTPVAHDACNGVGAGSDQC